MRDIRLLLVIFIWIQSSLTNGQSLKGQGYLLSGNINQDCTLENMCDCCLSNLIFIGNEQFVLIDFCEAGGTYTVGNYSMTKGLIKLSFKQFFVSVESDYLIEKRDIIKKAKKIDPLQFQFSSCGQKTETIENLKIKDYRYGIKQPAADTNNSISDLKKSKVWKLLMN